MILGHLVFLAAWAPARIFIRLEVLPPASWLSPEVWPPAFHLEDWPPASWLLPEVGPPAFSSRLWHPRGMFFDPAGEHRRIILFLAA